MTDKNEVITLSSDDESDFANKIEFNFTTVKPCSKILKSYLEKFDEITINKGVIIKKFKNEVKIVESPKILRQKLKDINKSPELVDLVDYMEKPNDNSQADCNNHEPSETVQVNSHSKLDIICIDETPVENPSFCEKKSDLDISVEKETRQIFHDLPLENVKTNKENITSDIKTNISKPPKNSNEIEEFYNEISEDKTDEDSNQNLKFFTEFVEFCGSLEKIPNDRARLTKKLMKRYGEADCSYIKSQEFRNLIQKCRDKINTYNLYLIAKEITDELSYKKKFEISTKTSKQVKKAKEKFHGDQSVVGNYDKVQQSSGQPNKNRIKFIKKIIQNLDKLGNKIRELEVKEVDLSDEEESSYIQLQRYRERFCQIYSKLCKYTNEVGDADRFYNRKICFTESKYPAINKCIENWLNKTRTFPDFSDIMKLLESQSSSLGLPTNRESIRVIAIEIFQQVGAMLQRRRIYDLWDLFCGFLDDKEDPANTDPALDKDLKSNFEARIKKEQEIFQHYAELQEKERLEPEEVPDEEANHSPVESENEDYKEIEDIENSINKKLDDAIKKETEQKGNTSENHAWGVGENDLENNVRSYHSLKLENTFIKSKESKNNFRNCKSLKWRLESGGKTRSPNSEDWNVGTENETEKEIENPESGMNELTKLDNLYSKEECKKPKESKKNCLDFDFIDLEKNKLNSIEVHNKIKTVGGSSLKKAFTEEDTDENQIPMKKKFRRKSKSDFDIFNINGKNANSNEKTEKVFNVHHCQIFTDSIFENLNGKGKVLEKRKVFRDLTNVNRLMELCGKKKKMSGLYSPLFFHNSFCKFEKSSWKKRFKVNFRFVGSKDQKCALNQEEKSGKTINSGKSAGEKGIQKNSESGRNNEGQNFFSGHGNGSEEDNNEDKNKKNGRSAEDLTENQFEEDEDEEENEAEKEDNKVDIETAKFSVPNKKTEESLNMNRNSAIPLENQDSSSENVESVQLSKVELKISASGSKSENKNRNDKEKQSETKIFLTRMRSKRENQKNDCQFNKETLNSKARASKRKKNVEDIDGGDEEKCAKMECTKRVSKIVKRNPKTRAKNHRKEIEECNEPRRKIERESNKVTSNKNLNENANMKTESEPYGQSLMEVNEKNELATQNKRNSSGRAAEEMKVRKKTSVILTKNENVKAQNRTQALKQEIAENKSANPWKPIIQIDLTSEKIQRKSTPSTSDEEIVKRFLMYSPASISITPPRKLTLSKPPSQAALQALATLRNLKGISTTLVRSKPKNEDDVIVVGGSYKSNGSPNSSSAKRIKTDLPVISSVQSIDTTTPKIVTVQGNVPGFENSWPETSNSSNSECNSSSIRISNVWGSLPNTFMQSGQSNEHFTPGRSSRQSNPGSSNSVKKKNSKKTVEYVVLE